MKKLDRNRPYGEVIGPCGHAYEQDGCRFDVDGNSIEPVPEKKRKKEADSEATSERETGSDDQVGKQMEG